MAEYNVKPIAPYDPIGEKPNNTCTCDICGRSQAQAMSFIVWLVGQSMSTGDEYCRDCVAQRFPHYVIPPIWPHENRMKVLQATGPRKENAPCTT